MSDELRDLIRFGCAGARGRAQKLAFIREGLHTGKLDNQPPYVHDVSFLDGHPEVSYDQQVFGHLTGRGTTASGLGTFIVVGIFSTGLGTFRI